jgi:probable HAF family extracellular repeat protein
MLGCKEPSAVHKLSGFTITATVLMIAAASLSGADSLAEAEPYTLLNLGLPSGAVSVIGVRMNNSGDVAGWSSFSEAPFLRGWFWTEEGGFTVLPPPPGFTRYRAMDISGTGVIAGDGGFDSGLAWRYEDGVFTVIGAVDGLIINYLGGVNEAGDIAGTSKDASFSTPDRGFLDINQVELLNLTPDIGGRATDVNNFGEVSGYSMSGGFGAFRWDQAGGLQFLGSLGLTHSFANAINDSGEVVGEALSATGNTSIPWIYTDGLGMHQIPAPVTQSSAATGINSLGNVVGTTQVTGPDLAWLWTGGESVSDLDDLFDVVAENITTIAAHDITAAGQILALGFDNNVSEFRTVVLTPLPEPGQLLVLGSGISVLGALYRRRTRELRLG